MEIDKEVFSFKDFIDGYLGNDKTNDILKNEGNDTKINSDKVSGIIEDIVKTEVVEEVVVEKDIVEVVENDNFYKLYKDKNEEFSCDISIEGSSIEETYARIIIESNDWNLVFNGEIKNGKCIVPIKKLGILKEGDIGNIKLEIIAEGNVFIPWEDKFKIKLFKKVTVNMNEQVKKEQYVQKGIDVKVNIK